MSRAPYAGKDARRPAPERVASPLLTGLLAELGRTYRHNALAAALGRSAALLTSWRYGRVMPSLRAVEEMAALAGGEIVFARGNPMREKLPGRRSCENTTLHWRGIRIEVQIGFYDDGRIGEVFLTTSKAGTEIDTACRDLALVISIALQHGCPFDVISKAATRDAAGRPEGLAATVCEHLERVRS